MTRFDQEELSERLLDFAGRVGKVVDSLPNTRLGRHIAGQLVRCGTSPAPNYAEACAAESRKDFCHKMSISLKELRESLVWIKMIIKSDLLPEAKLSPLQHECNQLCKIFAKSIVTAKSNQIKPIHREKIITVAIFHFSFFIFHFSFFILHFSFCILHFAFFELSYLSTQPVPLFAFPLMTAPFTISVLISGGGTTLHNLIEKKSQGLLAANICQVISNNPQAAGIQVAEQAGITCQILDHRKFNGLEPFSASVFDAIRVSVQTWWCWGDSCGD